MSVGACLPATRKVRGVLIGVAVFPPWWLLTAVVARFPVLVGVTAVSHRAAPSSRRALMIDVPHRGSVGYPQAKQHHCGNECDRARGHTDDHTLSSAPESSDSR